MNRNAKRVLIVGVGNELLGDEGLGVHIVRSLLSSRDRLPAHTEALEAGTALLDVLQQICQYPHVIIIDAIRAGGEPGTVYRAEVTSDMLCQGEAGPLLSLHQWSVMETLWAAKRLGMLPGHITLFGAEPQCMSPGLELSPTLARAADKIISALLAEIASMHDATGEDSRTAVRRANQSRPD